MLESNALISNYYSNITFLSNIVVYKITISKIVIMFAKSAIGYWELPSFVEQAANKRKCNSWGSPCYWMYRMRWGFLVLSKKKDALVRLPNNTLGVGIPKQVFWYVQEFEAGGVFNRHPINVNRGVLVICLLPVVHFESFGLIGVKEQVIVLNSLSSPCRHSYHCS